MKEARCQTSAKYCSFKVLVSNEEVQKETCRYCGRTEIWKLTPTGALVDNTGYLRAHARDFCQPGTRIFEEIYGRGAAKDVEKTTQIEEEHKRRQEELGEAFTKHATGKDKTIFT